MVAPRGLARKDNEIVRTNRLLLGVAIAAVVLLGPSFILGYFSGYRTARENAARGPSETALAVPPLGAPTSPAAAPKRSQRTAQTDHPAAGQVYLQLVTTAKSRSGTIVDALRNHGFPVVASDVPEKPELHRVLVGPLRGDQVAKMRADLNQQGFPGDSAIARTF